MDGKPIAPTADVAGAKKAPCCPAGRECADDEYEYCDSVVGTAYQAVTGGRADAMEPIATIPQEVLNSPKASAGIKTVMDGMGKPKNRKVTASVPETIAVELGANANISALETQWDQIYAKNEDVLRNYEPYYSIDATADGDVRELFRLRIGPVKSIRDGDALCRQLGRRGFSCSVVRIQ
jgi:hypothetical protein